MIANFHLMNNNYLQLFKNVSYNISIQWLSVLPRNPWILIFWVQKWMGGGDDKGTNYKSLQQTFLN